MTGKASWRCALPGAALGLAILGCGTGGGSVVFDAGYTAGTIIDSLLIQPAIAPEVGTTITASDTSPNVYTLKANATGLDTPFRYQWEQTAGDDATIAAPYADTTTVTLPDDATGEFVFVVTVTDAGGRHRTSEVRLGDLSS